ncbi:MAG: hypothetical protein ACLSE6_02455 [Alphaproteobacteria bacterium]
MDTFVHPSEPVFFSDEDFQNLPELAQKAQQINPDCDPKQDEAEILQLLDKFLQRRSRTAAGLPL